MRVSSESDRQITDLQRDALLAAVRRQPAPLFEDNASGAKDDRLGLNQARSRDTSRHFDHSNAYLLLLERINDA